MLNLALMLGGLYWRLWVWFAGVGFGLFGWVVLFVVFVCVLVFWVVGFGCWFFGVGGCSFLVWFNDCGLGLVSCGLLWCDLIGWV